MKRSNVIFAEHPVDRKVIGLVYGMEGYLSVVTDCSAGLLNSLNTGATQDVVQSYLDGSMFGWNTPAAEPALRFHQAMQRIALRKKENSI